MRHSLVAVVMVAVALAGAGTAEAGHGMEGSSAVEQQVAASIHRTLGCFACHGPAEHAPTGAAGASCAACHHRAAAEYAGGPHGQAARRDPPQAPTCVSCHGSHGVQRARDPQAPTSPARAVTFCRRCHEKPAADLVASVHGTALLARGSPAAPSCAACHGAHEAAGPLTPNSRVGRARVAETCGTCHVEARLAFGRSVHGTAAARGVSHTPTCTTCHGTHAVPAAADPRSPTSALRVAGETCARCHGSVRIAEMHNLPTRVVEDFRGSFHGLAGAAGDRRVANCASCHGYHEIRPSSSRFSRTHSANLGRTCGACHAGADDPFAQGGVHHTTASAGHRAVEWVGWMYAGMIGVVVGLMAIHNGLDFQRRWRDRRQRRAAAPTGAPQEHLRFTVNERVQHWTLAGSFALLALSGIALRFGWRVPFVDGQLQETLRAGTHRAAASLFGGLALYHVGYLTLTARGREMARAILPHVRSGADALYCALACARLGPPARADWRELVATVRYNLGLTRERPLYGRFTYSEKMEYWALGWGALVMASTGLALWFETPFLNRFPYWALELSRTIHFYEATLAVLAILVWHLYFTIANPDVFPLSRAMTRGTLTHEEIEREHPLDLRREGHETDESGRCVHGVGGNTRCGICHPDGRMEPDAGPDAAGGQAAGRQAGGGGGAPQADGGHQGS